MQLLKRVLGWGIVIYAVMYLAWSGLVIYGLSLGVLSLVARLIVLFVITGIAARSLRAMDWKDVVPYTIGWACIAILLDGIFLVPFSGWALYSSWSVWVGYGFIIVFPLLALFFSRRRGSLITPRAQ